MNVFLFLSRGLKTTARFWKMSLTVFLINFSLSTTLTFAFAALLNHTIQKSMFFDSMLKEFDYQIFTEFLQRSNNGLTILLSGGIAIAFFYAMMNIFLSGGILRSLNKDKFTFSNFWAGCGSLFSRFFKLSLAIFALQIFIALLLYALLTLLLSMFYDNFSTEISLYLFLGITFLIHFFCIIFLLLTADFAKFYLMIHDSEQIFISIANGVKFLFRNIGKSIFIFLSIFILQLLFFYLYFHFDNDIGITSIFTMILMFFVQQFFIFLRISSKIWLYSALFEFYAAEFFKPAKIQSQQEFYSLWDQEALELYKKEK